MTHTLPPWTSKYKLSTLYVGMDFHELAARLGSVILWDRRGNVLWYDDFEGSSAKWASVTGGADSTVGLDTGYSWNGSQSMKLYTHATAGSFARMSKDFVSPTQYKVGAGFYARLADANCYLQLSMTGYTGTVRYQGILRIYPDDKVIKYKNSLGSYVSVCTACFPTPGDELWLPVKLVIDWENYKYSRVTVGNTIYDLATKSLYSAASANPPEVTIEIELYAEAAANQTAYIDGFYLCIDES